MLDAPRLFGSTDDLKSTLEYMLQSCTWQLDGLYVPNSNYTHKLFKFVRTAIMDAHVPIYKITGINIKGNQTHGNINNTFDKVCPFRERRLGSNESFTRNVNIGESYISLHSIVTKFVFTKPFDAIATGYDKAGVITLRHFQVCKYVTGEGYLFGSQSTFITSTDFIAEKDDTLFHCLGMTPKWVVLLRIGKGTGYWDSKTSAEFNPKKSSPGIVRAFYAFPQVFTLDPYVRVLPKFDSPNYISYKLYHGITVSYLQERFESLITDILQDKLEERFQWVKDL